MRKKIILIILILIINTILLSGCYDARGIEDLAYATAIGLDVSKNKMLSLTLQFSIPNSSSESGSSQSNKTNIITIPCTSINSGLSLINSYVSKEVNLSHCKVVVISEELAKQGIAEYIDTLANHIEIRPDCNVIVTRCTAENFIKNASPSIETLTARYYEIALKSSEYTGYTTYTKLSDFIGNIKNTFIQGSAILGGITNSSETVGEDGVYNGMDSNYKANETPIKNSSGVETFGTAVFFDDKLVGELTGIETICHLIVTDELKSCILSIPDPFNANSSIDLNVSKKKAPKIKVEFINNSPYITIDTYLEAYGLSLDQNTDYSSAEDIHVLNKYAEKYLKEQLSNYLYKTSREFNSDIAGFGKHALSKYLTWDKWLDSGWLENYKNSFFNINVNISIISGYEFNKSP